MHHFITSRGINSPPIVEPGMAEYDAWHQYFVRHLGWSKPWMIDCIEIGTLSNLVVPTLHPSWFDPSFTEQTGWQPPAKPKLPRIEPKIRANVFVPKGFPHYTECLQRHESEPNSPAYSDRHECHDKVTRDGIWVPVGWLPEKRAGAWKKAA